MRPTAKKNAEQSPWLASCVELGASHRELLSGETARSSEDRRALSRNTMFHAVDRRAAVVLRNQDLGEAIEEGFNFIAPWSMKSTHRGRRAAGGRNHVKGGLPLREPHKLLVLDDDEES